MTRISASVVLVVFLFALATLLPTTRTWNAVTAHVSPSTGLFEGHLTQGFTVRCTAFSINQAKGYFLTAHHCHVLDATFTIDGHPAFIVWENLKIDTMMVVILTDGYPQLEPRRDAIKTGLGVVGLGHGYGLNVNMVMTGVVSNGWIDTIEDFPGAFVMTDFPLISGMSGGPVVDSAGRVVGLQSFSNGSNGYLIPISELLKYTGRYWGR